ncbi:MAG: hypothetical protein KDC90_13165, partial [Ignavibacteriae bacterium]|nr:hypothetical protein [Ignavibacteriota bacterium]
NVSSKDIFKDAFKIDERPIVKFPLGIILLLIYLIIFSIGLTIWPIVYIIRLFNENNSWEKKLKVDKKQKEEKLKKIQAKYEGFNLKLLNPIILERKDDRAAEISKGFPTNVILYVAEKPHPFVEVFFKKNIEDIKTRFLENHPYDREYKFVIPEATLFDNFNNIQLGEKLTYNFPYISSKQKIIESLRVSSIYDFTQQLRKDLSIEFPMGPGLFRVINGPGNSFNFIRFSYVELPLDSEVNLDKALWCYLAHLKEANSDTYFKLIAESDLKGMGQSYKLSDFRFNYQAHKLSKEVADKIESMKLLGYENILMRGVLNKMEGYEIRKTDKSLESQLGKKLSPMIIDQNFKIYLTDYNNLEIKMPALSKALYLLFLRHSEGIILKHLSDHKSELLKIYQSISLRESYDEAIASIEDLVNPLSNSVNEKASRIKCAFVKHFSEDIARHYHITGERGEKKVIILKRSLIEWKVEDLDWPFQRGKSTEKSKQEERIIDDKYSQALKLIAKKDYEQAKSLLTDIIELNNNHFDAYKLRAICHFDLLQYEQAERDNNLAIKLNPETCVSHHNRAEARLMLGKYQEALEDITKYLKEVDNKCAESYYIRGLIHFEQNSEKAKQDFVNAIKLGHEDAKKMLKQCQGKIPKQAFFEEIKNQI